MKPYKNLSENSGVVAYEIYEKAISIKFRDGVTYFYDHQRPGKRHVDNMKSLAMEGQGLSTYVSRYVKENYQQKIN